MIILIFLVLIREYKKGYDSIIVIIAREWTHTKIYYLYSYFYLQVFNMLTTMDKIFRLVCPKKNSSSVKKFCLFLMENCSLITSATFHLLVRLFSWASKPETTQFLGIQGSDIGDVKFNLDGDGLGRYSVYQYQQKEVKNSSKTEWGYEWIGEFGEMDNYRWEKINENVE